MVAHARAVDLGVGEYAREVVLLRVSAPVGDDLPEELQELDAERLERRVAIRLAALELGVLAGEQLLRQAQHGRLVRLGHAEDRAQDAQRVLHRDLGHEVERALAVALRVVEPVDQALRARLHHLVDARRAPAA